MCHSNGKTWVKKQKNNFKGILETGNIKDNKRLTCIGGGLGKIIK
jgi:hypothetical protein